jgi:hypothetical protein
MRYNKIYNCCVCRKRIVEECWTPQNGASLLNNLYGDEYVCDDCKVPLDNLIDQYCRVRNAKIKLDKLKNGELVDYNKYII